MKIYENKSQFGWPGDNGIGEQLILQVSDGKKTATAAPKSLYSLEQVKDLYSSVGMHGPTLLKMENSF